MTFTNWKYEENKSEIRKIVNIYKFNYGC